MEGRAIVRGFTEVETMNMTRATAPNALSLPASTRALAGLAALCLGLFFVWGTGFAGSATIHDTAHDMRHGFGFPCH